jgi:DNA-binding NarL/FixJ family response regulator
LQTVLIVDDHALFRAGVHALLASELPNFELIEAENTDVAMEILREKKVDQLILDYELPAEDGITFLARLRQAGYQQPVTILTGIQTASIVDRAVTAGANQVLAKLGDGTELIKALTQPGKPLVSDSFQANIEGSELYNTLTNREKEVFRILIGGASTQDIAAQLGTSFKTAETHRTRIMAKFDVHSYAELIAKSKKLGLH